MVSVLWQEEAPAIPADTEFVSSAAALRTLSMPQGPKLVGQTNKKTNGSYLLVLLPGIERSACIVDCADEHDSGGFAYHP